MQGISVNVMRTGKKYRLVNYGERHEFVVERILEGDDCYVKDLLTLERYRLKELTQYGKGEDYCLEELR